MARCCNRSLFLGQGNGGGGSAAAGKGKGGAGSVKVSAWKGVGGDDHVAGEKQAQLAVKNKQRRREKA